MFLGRQLSSLLGGAGAEPPDAVMELCGAGFICVRRGTGFGCYPGRSLMRWTAHLAAETCPDGDVPKLKGHWRSACVGP